jgi:sporulation protein YqfD
MQAIDLLILGFFELSINPLDLERITSLFLRHGIRMKSKDNKTVRVFYNQKDEAIKILADSKINYDISREFKIIGIHKDKKRNILTISALLFTLIFVILISNLVWCIEVDGNVEISDATIISILAESGLYVGSAWSKVDFGEVENSFLNNCKDIGWININRNGTVAHISVVEAEVEEKHDNAEIQFSNIVAKEDCIIEYIRAIQGVAVVKVGDAVSKGDALIVGINQSGDGPCAAEGVVVGRVNKSITATTCRKKLQKSVLKSTLTSVKIKIFNFSINIFKKYGNLGIDCDIIEEKNKITLTNGRKLPIEILKEYEVQYVMNYFELTDEGLVNESQYRMNNLLQSELSNVHLNSIRTYGDFTDTGYVIISELVYTCDVSESVKFTVN